MRPKFNKETQRWGVWVEAFGGLWMVRDSALLDLRILKFQSKQEAQKFINKMVKGA